MKPLEAPRKCFFFLILRGFFFLNKMFVTFAQLLDIYSPKTHAEVLKIDDICG